MSNKEKGELAGRVAVVTGARGGIGAATALELGCHGVYVVGTSTSAEGANDISTMLREASLEGTGLELDLRQLDTFPKFIFEVIETANGRPITILVNNAGVRIDNLALQTRPKELDEVMLTNFRGPIELTRLTLRGMVRAIKQEKAEKGSVVMVGSVGARGEAGQLSYSSSKAALTAAVGTLSREYSKRGIRINGVAPGLVITDMTRELPQERIDEIVTQTSLGRPGTPEEIARVVRFIASEEASFVTGSIWEVDGGIN